MEDCLALKSYSMVVQKKKKKNLIVWKKNSNILLENKSFND